VPLQEIENTFPTFSKGLRHNWLEILGITLTVKPMSTELETNLPSIRQIQTLIREEQEVELKLVTNDLLTGKLRWQDAYCICLIDHYDQPTLIWRNAIVFIKPKF
jgi:host factor-I protein